MRTTMQRERLMRWGIPALLVIGLVSVGVATSMHDRGVSPVTLPGGTTIEAALASTVSTDEARVGDNVELATREPQPVNSEFVLPPGTAIHGEVISTHGGGRIAGAPELAIRFTQLELDGRRYAISAAPFRLRGKNDAAESAEQIGGGAAAGGLLGAVLGGKSGLVKGAVAGAAVGTGVAVATKGEQLVLPAGRRLRVLLTAPVTIMPPGRWLTP